MLQVFTVKFFIQYITQIQEKENRKINLQSCFRKLPYTDEMAIPFLTIFRWIFDEDIEKKR